MLLARAGLDVLVVDRSRAGADTLSTHALMRGGVLQLHRWGLLDAVVAAGTPPVRRTTFPYADDDRADHDQAGARRRRPLRAAPHVLDPILVDAAGAAGAEVRFGTTVTGVTRDDAGRVDGVEGFDERRHPHAPHRPVGDRRRRRDVGRRPRRRRAVRAPRHRRDRRASTATGPDLDVDGYEWVFRPERCAGAIPTNDGQTCVFAAATPGAHRTRRHRRAARRRRRGVARPGRPARRRRRPGRRAQLRRPARPPPPAVGPGWALVGDAGYWKDPISAHGLTDALRDAELLARAVIDARVRPTPPSAAAFADYHAHPRPAVAAAVRRRRHDRRHALDRRRDPRPAPAASMRRWPTRSRPWPACRAHRPAPIGG